MALKSFVLFVLLAHATFAYGQEKHCLVVFDLSKQGKSYIVQNPIAADSTGVISGIPSFHPEEPVILYASFTNDSSRICSFNYETRQYKTVLASRTLLRSPMVTPDRRFISFLAGDKQKLVLRKLPAGGGAHTLVSADYAFESYQWIDDNSMLITIGGDPNSLMLITLRPKRSIPVARNVGPTIHRTRDYLAFVHKLSVDSWSIKRISNAGNIELITHTLQETDRFAVTPEGQFLMVQENTLYYRDDKGWKVIDLIAPKDVQQILSISVNHSGDKLLMVIELP